MLGLLRLLPTALRRRVRLPRLLTGLLDLLRQFHDLPALRSVVPVGLVCMTPHVAALLARGLTRPLVTAVRRLVTTWCSSGRCRGAGQGLVLILILLLLLPLARRARSVGARGLLLAA